ncbi:hypothetical protein N331_08889, partial [Merops nubicus]
ISTLNFKKANFQLFKELLNRTPWEAVLRDKGTEQSWQIHKEAFHRVQELSKPMCRKSGKKRKRLAWLSHKLLVELKNKVKLHKQLKQGQVSWRKCRVADWLWRDKVRKAKVQLQLNLAKNTKKNKKGFYKYLNQKRKVKEGVSTLVINSGELVTWDEEQAKVLSNFFASVFTGNPSLHSPQDKDQVDKAPPTVSKDKV